MLSRLNIQDAMGVELIYQHGGPDPADTQGPHLQAALTLVATLPTTSLQLILSHCYVTAEFAAQLTAVADQWAGMSIHHPVWTTGEPQGVQLPALNLLRCDELTDSVVGKVGALVETQSALCLNCSSMAQHLAC